METIAATAPTFGAPALAAVLTAMSDLELDALDFGVVEMDHACTVLRYNATESRLSGLPPDRVVGRQFFREVAPCSNNAVVAQRFAAATLDATIPYTLSLRMKAVPVTLRLLKAPDSKRMYFLVSTG
jgi:photoactive yellow protein